MTLPKKSFFIVAIFLLFLCAVAFRHRHEKSVAGLQKESIHIQNMDRIFYVHVPPGKTDQPFPVLLAFHGRLGTGDGMARLSQLNAVADRHHFLVAYPNGYEKSWADGRGKTAADTDHIDDLGFVKKLLEKLNEEYRIDPKKVYASGISNGGFFAQRLACEMSDSFAGVEAVASTLSEATSLSCKPKNPISVMIIMGTNDPLVPFNGGEMSSGNHPKVLSAQDSFKRWAEIDSCEGQPELTKISDAVQLYSYASCKDNSHISLYTIQGGGHTWPGGVQYLPEIMVGKTNRDIDAGELFADFASLR